MLGEFLERCGRDVPPLAEAMRGQAPFKHEHVDEAAVYTEPTASGGEIDEIIDSSRHSASTSLRTTRL